MESIDIDGEGDISDEDDSESDEDQEDDGTAAMLRKSYEPPQPVKSYHRTHSKLHHDERPPVAAQLVGHHHQSGQVPTEAT